MAKNSGNYYSGICGISSSTLKIIAISAMLLDHIAAAFEDQLSGTLFCFSVGGLPLPRLIGRIAFPIFAFLIAEGASRTKNIYKYMLRLLIFAFISEIPFDLALFHTPLNEVLFETEHQNVFFTLLLGLLAIYAFQMFQKIRLEVLSFPILLILSFIAETLLKTDYGAMGVICIFLLYVFLHAPGAAKHIGITLTLLLLPFIIKSSASKPGNYIYFNTMLYYNSFEIYAVLALPFILLYNGEKGKKLNKYFFYGFYPGHLAIIWVIYKIFA
ncbi:MAG: hypothetical protein J1E34_07245 [Oscillospiraceae bacterium]|nr:hypothetical protein [Oscillospiraceae bacterium]